MLKLRDLTEPQHLPQETVDKAHALFLHALRERIRKIHLVRNLRYPGPGIGVPLFGLQWKKTIYLAGGCPKDLAVSTLIHELIHFVFKTSDRVRDEAKTLKAEFRLFEAFSEEQKEQLWHFIPKKVTLENVDDENLP